SGCEAARQHVAARIRLQQIDRLAMRCRHAFLRRRLSALSLQEIYRCAARTQCRTRERIRAAHLYIYGFRCDGVTLFSGAVYQLYRYKKYTDVRLVFVPEFDIAFFGGDPDNFEFPRYDLDIAFFRIYENGSPVHLDDYLKWETRDLKEGDLVFV